MDGEPAAARRELTEARDIFHTFGLRADGAQVDKLLARLGQLPLSPAGCRSCVADPGLIAWLEDLPHAVLRGGDSHLEHYGELAATLSGGQGHRHRR